MQNKSGTKFFAILLAMAIIAGVFVAETMANKGNKGGDDIILYNGNIVLRGNGKGKGKGGGSIVVANSPSMEMMPSFDWGMGGFGRRRR